MASFSVAMQSRAKYSQSENPESPYFSDQTKLFSRGEWVKERFCEPDILRSPALRIVVLR